MLLNLNPVTVLLLLSAHCSIGGGSEVDSDVERFESILRGRNVKPENHRISQSRTSNIWLDKHEADYRSSAEITPLKTAVKGDSTSRIAEGHAVITIALYTDIFPEEIGFVLTSASTGAVIARQAPGFIAEKAKIYTETSNVVEGHAYTLTVTDTYGDGILEPAFVAVFYGSTPTPELEIVRQGAFQAFSADQEFVAQEPITAAPSVSMAPSTSPAPTHSPTMCISAEENAWKVAEDGGFEHHFLTTTRAFGFDTCKRHNSYVDCTNEKGQDCQWQFLGTSPRNGVCRVDPISACLANGNCVCDTGDFHGGSANMADGILFHAPISVTARDISPFAHHLQYYETYTTPSNQNTAHPQNDEFFISKVDFTSRVLSYEFDADSPVPQVTDFTIAFKLHYLYWDTPMVGSLWNGLGLSIDINTLGMAISINGRSYRLPPKLRRWTCTSIVITNTAIFVGRIIIMRELSQETSFADDSVLHLGPFSGELFDVRVYSGALSFPEVREFGARCTSPDDPAALELKRDLEHLYLILGCDPDLTAFHADAGGPVPNTGGHTYGSGPFGTLWVKPKMNPFNASEYEDIPEGEFDEEHYFQQAKIQAYLWERYLYQADMLAYNQEPYRYFKSNSEVPEFAAKYWNNPCRYANNFNNGWQYPIYGNNLPKWNLKEQGGGTTPFDLGHLYQTQGSPEVWTELNFVSHEMFHAVQGNIADVYAGEISQWIAESTAEYGSDLALPGSSKLSASFVLAPGYPLGFLEYRDAKRGQHFMSEALSINEWIRGGHIYASWVVWWFLSDHAGLPHLVGQMHSTWHARGAYTAGEVFLLRELVENANMDFGDVWSIFIAHLRTWDFPLFAEQYRASEQKDFEALMSNGDIDPPISRDVTLEGRKIAAEIDPHFGTGGQFVEGPSALLPGPNGWNGLTMRSVDVRRYLSIEIQWDNGMGFADNVEPSYLPEQQHGCDDDPRFYSTIVVAHNEATGQRRYWKLKGKTPPILHISTGSSGPVTIHIILVPTPPSDYVGGRYVEEGSRVGFDAQVTPIPVYGYKYKVQISDQQLHSSLATEEDKEYGIIKFDAATPGWWSVECTCLERPSADGNRCIRPTFDGVIPTSPPSVTLLPPNKAPPVTATCFSGESAVYVENKGSILLKYLELGDKVLVADSTFSEVYSFGHRHESIQSEYLQIFTENSPRPLEVSPNHMIFVGNGEAIPASNVRVGDQVLTASRYQLMSASSIVVAIETVVRAGAYAPFTFSGTIVVNGIKASSYVAFQDSPFLKLGKLTTPLSYHWMAHTSQLPHRLYCAYVGSCTKEQYNEVGLSKWVAWPHSFAQWLLRQNALVMALFLIPLTILLLLLSVLEILLFYSNHS